MDPEGFSEAAGKFDHCALEWTFSILAEPSGRFVVWADETEKFSGRAEGNTGSNGMLWNWR